MMEIQVVDMDVATAKSDRYFTIPCQNIPYRHEPVPALALPCCTLSAKVTCTTHSCKLERQAHSGFEIMDISRFISRHALV